MRSLVVYESYFGNTRLIAEEIAAALGDEGEAEIVSVDDPLPPLHGIDLIVLGAPTHVHGLSGQSSRKNAIEKRGLGGDVGIGARGWIDELPLAGTQKIAVFDTRAHKPVLLVGSAGHGMAKRLRHRGYRLVREPESFFVKETQGPLETQELERAAAWAKTLAEEVALALV
jgi:hypothetical protein